MESINHTDFIEYLLILVIWIQVITFITNYKKDKNIKNLNDNDSNTKALFDYSDVVMFRWNNDDNWSVDYVSENTKTILGYPRESFINEDISYLELIHPEDIGRVKKEVEENGNKHFFKHEPYRVKRSNGKYIWVNDNTKIIYSDKGKIEYYLGFITDVTTIIKMHEELKNTNEKIKNLMYKDELTGIYNRRKFNEIINKLIKEKGNSFSFVICDIDYFKKINDTYGHIVGDNILKELSSLVKKNIRKEDVFFRWGGEEFVIIMSEIEFEKAIQKIESLRKIIENYSFASVNDVKCSFGIIEYNDDMSLDFLMKEADKKLYKAKKLGRNRVVF